MTPASSVPERDARGSARALRAAARAADAEQCADRVTDEPGDEPDTQTVAEEQETTPRAGRRGCRER